ncbi:MAG: energy transducer TonB [Acidobacteria bacterium]|nr:energy transducer TonB [Acidobacteriota bacterium]
MSYPPSVPEVFSARELAHMAGVPRRRVRDLMASGDIRTIEGEFVSETEAARAIPLLTRARHEDSTVSTRGERPLFAPPPASRRAAGLPLAVSSTLHAVVVGGAVLMTTLGITSTEARVQSEEIKSEPMRMVYLALPGPGGGGGGGGLKQKAPPPKAQRKGKSKLNSPLPVRVPPRPVEPVVTPVEQPKPSLKAEPLPPIVAPVATLPSNTQDRAGVLEETTAENNSRGPGQGGGVGSGEGTGIGEGDGQGIGPGSGGGTGGGPYRQGSGIEPPRLLREIKPDYTEEARHKSIEGEVVLEIVVRRDGSVGDVRLVQSLGHGLDRRAMEAVRQWRFAPARRRGTPVDVMVEVAVEFKLR